jgi:hypothetical protein
MSNALTVYDQFDELQRAAIALQESGYFKDVTSKAQAIVKVMAGAELGLPPFASMTGIHIIQGKPVLGANVIATLVKNDPRYNYSIVNATDDECLIQWFENGESQGKSSFTMVEAKSIGLATKDNWKKYPSDMLFARAISRGARRFAPGIFGGSPIYTPDEMGADVDENGNTIVDSVMVDVPVQTSTVTITDETQPQVTFTEPKPELLPPSNGNVYDAIVEAGLSENVHAAKNALQNYCRTGYDTTEKAIAWMRMYRGWKDLDLTTIEAGAKANLGESPK